jgi:hypothetical protein
MKAVVSLLAGVSLLAQTASAVPLNISGNNQFGVAGMAFEQYVGTVAVWSPGAALQGLWKSRGKSAKPDGAETFVLGSDATVFGIAASRVTAERANGAVRRFTVIFDEGKLKNGKMRTGGLYEQVISNITAFAGEAKTASPGGEKAFRHEATLITARKSGGKEVTVEFTPAR